MPVSLEELQTIDYGWLAVDDAGYVAVLCTGGDGPVPATAIPNSFEVEEELPEALLSEEPIRSSYMLFIECPRPDSFIEIAQRGVFAYNWGDACRTLANCIGEYELAAAPTVPVKIDQLAPNVQKLANATRLPGVKFLLAHRIQVES